MECLGNPEATGCFVALSNAPKQEEICKYAPILAPDAPILEKFTCLLYNRTTTCSKVNDLRRELFTKNCRSMESLLPTQGALEKHIQRADNQGALEKHIQRAAYQAGHIWENSLILAPQIPKFVDWGWKLNESGIVFPEWTNMAPLPMVLQELIKCGCSVGLGCNKRCRCN